MALRKTVQVNDRVKSEDILLSTEAEEVFMGIGLDQAAMANITNLLTDMYENPVEATVREVVSNAIDATVRAGATSEVRVTTPTVLNPTFTVQDFGVGMDRETVSNVYSQYGASTKGDDFSQIGAFGLGAKAPLAYCTEYSVETTKDGITTYFTVGRKQLGNFTRILSSKKTGKPNGTIVKVPARVDDTSQFQFAVDNYRRYSLDTPIVMDGQPFNPSVDLLYLFDQELEEGITGRVWVNKEDIGILIKSFIFPITVSYNRQNVINVTHLLSGWSYPSPENNSRRGIRIVSELKPGVVDYTTSRDAIVSNDRSKALYEKIEENFKVIKHQELYDRLMEHYRSASIEQQKGILSQMARADVFKDPDLKNGSWTVGSVKLSTEDFTDVNGVNLLTSFTSLFSKKPLKGNTNAVFLLQSNIYGKDFYSVGDSLKEGPLNRRIDSDCYNYRISDHNETAKNAVENNEHNLNLAETVFNIFLNDGTLERKFLVITEVDSTNISKVIRSRNLLKKNDYDNSAIFVTDLKASSLNMSVFEGVVDVETMSITKFVEWAKNHREIVSRNARVQQETCWFYKIKDAENFDFETSNYLPRLDGIEKVEASLDDIITEGSTIYLGDTTSTAVSKTVYGAMNAKIPVGTLYVPLDGNRAFFASAYNLMKDYQNVIVSKEFSYNANAAKEIAVAKTYHAAYPTEQLESVPLEILKKSYAQLRLGWTAYRMKLMINLEGELGDLLAPLNEEDIYNWKHVLGDMGRVGAAIELRDNVFRSKIDTINELLQNISYGYGDDLNDYMLGCAIRKFSEGQLLENETVQMLAKDVLRRVNLIWNQEG